MTEFHVETVRIGSMEKHPNADSLSITQIHGGYPVILRTSDWSEGDLAVYIPVDSLVPQTSDWAFLSPAGNAVVRDKDRRIRAKKLRGVFSMGMLAKPPADVTEPGLDVAEVMGITKYEADEFVTGYRGHGASDGLEIPGPILPIMPGKYDIEGFRRHSDGLFLVDEPFVVTEKIHGQNARFVHDGDRLHVGSRTRWLVTDPETNTWAAVAKRYDLATKLATVPGLILFGETYGNNADMPYAVERGKTGDAFAAFDIWDSKAGAFLCHDDFVSMTDALGLPRAPILAQGQWRGQETYAALLPLAEGPSTMAPHVREGFVIKPKVERWDHRIGRVIVKLHGEGFLTRKDA